MCYNSDIVMKTQRSILVRLPEDVKIRAEMEAKELGISLSGFIRLLLSQYFNGVRFERRASKEKNNG